MKDIRMTQKTIPAFLLSQKTICSLQLSPLCRKYLQCTIYSDNRKYELI